MNQTLQMVLALLKLSDVRISEHGYDELAEDGLTVTEILDGMGHARVVEDYPDYPKGPSVWCYSLIVTGDRFIRSGESRKGITGQQCW